MHGKATELIHSASESRVPPIELELKEKAKQDYNEAGAKDYNRIIMASRRGRQGYGQKEAEVKGSRSNMVRDMWKLVAVEICFQKHITVVLKPNVLLQAQSIPSVLII